MTRMGTMTLLKSRNKTPRKKDGKIRSDRFLKKSRELKRKKGATKRKPWRIRKKMKIHIKRNRRS